MRAYVIVSFDTSDTHTDESGLLVGLKPAVDGIRSELQHTMAEHRPLVTVTVNPRDVRVLDLMTDPRRDPQDPVPWG